MLSRVEDLTGAFSQVLVVIFFLRSIQAKTHRHLAVVASLQPTLQQSTLYRKESSSPLSFHASALLRSVKPVEMLWKSLAVHVMHSAVSSCQCV